MFTSSPTELKIAKERKQVLLHNGLTTELSAGDATCFQKGSLIARLVLWPGMGCSLLDQLEVVRGGPYQESGLLSHSETLPQMVLSSVK
jgi:hypothetical protein